MFALVKSDKESLHVCRLADIVTEDGEKILHQRNTGQRSVVEILFVFENREKLLNLKESAEAALNENIQAADEDDGLAGDAGTANGNSRMPNISEATHEDVQALREFMAHSERIHNNIYRHLPLLPNGPLSRRGRLASRIAHVAQYWHSRGRARPTNPANEDNNGSRN